jgi:hypothetical protein
MCILGIAVFTGSQSSSFRSFRKHGNLTSKVCSQPNPCLCFLQRLHKTAGGRQIKWGSASLLWLVEDKYRMSSESCMCQQLAHQRRSVSTVGTNRSPMVEILPDDDHVTTVTWRCEGPIERERTKLVPTAHNIFSKIHFCAICGDISR